MLNTNVGLRFRRFSVHKRAAVLSADSKYSADHISLLHLPHLRLSRSSQPAAAALADNCDKQNS